MCNVTHELWTCPVSQSKGWELELECPCLSHRKVILNERFTAVLIGLNLESNLSPRILSALDPHGAEANLTSRLSFSCPYSMYGKISNWRDNRLMKCLDLGIFGAQIPCKMIICILMFW